MARYPYGGQAVIEGVMMRGPKTMAIAVRTPQQVIFEIQDISSLTERYPFLKWPIIRGFIALIESLVIGIKSLTFSANQVLEGEGESIKPWELTLSVVFAIVAGVGLFFLLPVGLAYLLETFISQHFWQNIIEGIFRIAIFLTYVVAISRFSDIQRVFEYHGAEHKVIHTYEAEEELTVENVRKYPTLHPRCGTSFLLFVMVISILVFSLLGETDIITRLASRILLLPLVAGISYEFLKLTGKYQRHWFMRMASAPGMWLQKLTTREPDNDQIEVAIIALNSVLDADESSSSAEAVLPCSISS